MDGRQCTVTKYTDNSLFLRDYHINMKREKNQLDATQWFNELMIRSTCFGHYYSHHQELETVQMITACGIKLWL